MGERGGIIQKIGGIYGKTGGIIQYLGGITGETGGIGDIPHSRMRANFVFRHKLWYNSSS